MRTAIGDFRQRGIAVARRPRGKALVVENARNQVPNVGFVIDNQNITCHGSRLPCQLPVAALIFASLLVVSSRPAVSTAGSFIACSFVSTVCSFTSTLGACPDTANRIRIHAPRRPGRKSEAS